MKKIISLAIAGLTSLCMAAEEKVVSFSGYMDADMAIDVNKDFKDPRYQANQEVDLTTDVKVTDAVSVQLYTTFLHGNVPYGSNPASARWGGLAFDGLTLTWALNEDQTVYVGDLLYNMGGFGYYALKRTVAYGSVQPEAYLRGGGIDISGLSLYAGATDKVSFEDSSGTEPVDVTDQFGIYASYSVPLGEGLSLVPKADIRLGGVETDWHAAVEFGFEGPVSISGTIGALSEGGLDPNLTVLLEPSFSSGPFSLAGTFFLQTFDGTDLNVTSLANITDEWFGYIEPGFSFNDLFAFGLPLEYHQNYEADESSIWVVPTAYLYPAKDVEVWLWAGGVFPEDSDAAYSAGSELIVSF